MKPENTNGKTKIKMSDKATEAEANSKISLGDAIHKPIKIS